MVRGEGGYWEEEEEVGVGEGDFSLLILRPCFSQLYVGLLLTIRSKCLCARVHGVRRVKRRTRFVVQGLPVFRPPLSYAMAQGRMPRTMGGWKTAPRGGGVV